MRYITVFAASVLTLGNVSTSLAENRPRHNEVNVFQMGKDGPSGMAVANIKVFGDAKVVLGQEGWETHGNIETDGYWGDVTVQQKADGPATLSAIINGFTGNASLKYDIEAGDTSSVDADLKGVGVQVLGQQVTGGDNTLKLDLGGNHIADSEVVQDSESGSVYGDVIGWVDEGSKFSLWQKAPGERIANVDIGMGYSPNWDFQKPYKDAAERDKNVAADLF